MTDMSNFYFVILENGEIYLLEKGYNNKKYFIFENFLFRRKGLKKLGKVKEIKPYEWL